MPRIHYRSYKGITLLARNLRKNMTDSEKVLWSILRNKSFSGYKFLRQHPVFYRIDREWIEFFIADFYCARLRIIIELDGGIHELRKEYDKESDEKLFNKGILVCHFKNQEVEDLVKLEKNIRRIITNRLSYLSLNK